MPVAPSIIIIRFLRILFNSTFTSDDKFKTYDALKKRLDAVLGRKQQLRAPDPEVAEEETLEDLSEGRASVASTEETDEDADDALSYFQKLAED